MSSRYLHGNIDHGLHIQSASGFSLTSFSDTDWASCVNDQRSTNGFYVFLGPSIVHGVHPSKRMLQDPTLLSGYKALAHAATEVTWLQALLKDLQVPSSTCPVI